MSDAKAKAEARRAKILARDASKRMVSAITTEEDEVLLSVGDVKAKERPLASRRSFIKAVSQQMEIDDDVSVTESAQNTPKKEEKPFSESSSDKKEGETKAEDEKSKEGEAESGKKESDKSSVDSEKTPDTPKSSSVKPPPAKTLEEIEREVAENTAKFDKKTLAGKGSKDSKATADKAAKLKLIAQAKEKVAVDPSNLMRLLRLVLVAALAAFTGYRTAETARIDALKALSAPQDSALFQTIQEFDEFGNVSREVQVPIASGATATKVDPAEGRTWLGYVQYQYTKRTESSVTAVMLVWWVAGMFKNIVYSQAKQQKPKQNIIEQVYGYINGLQEAVLNCFGEFAWHCFVLILTVQLHTAYYSHLALSAATASGVEGSAAETVAAEL